MTTPQITALPTPPSRNDPSNFSTRADSFLGALPAFTTETNNLATYLNNLTVEFIADNLSSTSSTNFPLDASAKTLIIETNKSFSAGMLIKITDTISSSKYLICTVTSYDKMTGVLVASVNSIEGTGTVSTSNISLSAPVQSSVNTGDIVITARTMASPSWLPADGAIYSQASYAALYAELGLLRDGIARSFGVATTLTQGIGDIAAQPGEGIGLFPLLTAGTTWLIYNKATGVGNNRLARSTDGGVSWTQATLPNPATDQQYTRIVSHNSGATLVAVHASTDAWVARSTDNGATWTTVGVAGYGGNGQLFVVNGTYVLLSAAAATAWTSTDGAAWTSRTPPAALTLLTVSTYNGSQVATAWSGPSPFTTIYTTSDGITWTSNPIASVSTGSGYGASTLASGNDVLIWMPTSTETTYRRSTNGGATWTSPATPEINGTRIYPAAGRVSVFDGRFVFASYGTGRANIASSTDGLTWVVETVPIPVIDENVNTITCVVGGELWLVLTSIGQYTVYTLPKWGKEWVLFNGSDTWSALTSVTAQEMGGVQMYVSVGTTQPRRRSVYTYNSATQFAVPTVLTPPGVTAYIKT